MMVLEGNHEIEKDAANATFQAFTHRFRVPYKESGSPSPLFYSFDLAGELTASPRLSMLLKPSSGSCCRLITTLSLPLLCCKQTCACHVQPGAHV